MTSSTVPYRSSEESYKEIFLDSSVEEQNYKTNLLSIKSDNQTKVTINYPPPDPNGTFNYIKYVVLTGDYNSTTNKFKPLTKKENYAVNYVSNNDSLYRVFNRTAVVYEKYKTEWGYYTNEIGYVNGVQKDLILKRKTYKAKRDPTYPDRYVISTDPSDITEGYYLLRDKNGQGRLTYNNTTDRIIFYDDIKIYQDYKLTNPQ
jgi:hypothetical protein